MKYDRVFYHFKSHEKQNRKFRNTLCGYFGMSVVQKDLSYLWTKINFSQRPESVNGVYFE